MKTNSLACGLILFLSYGFINIVVADDYSDGNWNMPYGPRGMMGMDAPMGQMNMMDGRMGFGMLSRLNLSEEQEKKINKLRDDLQKEHWKIKGDIIDLQSKLRQTFDEDRPDPKSVGDIVEGISKLERKMVEGRVETMNKIRDLLTDEQRKQLKSGTRRYGWGGGPMMHRGWKNYDQ